MACLGQPGLQSAICSTCCLTVGLDTSLSTHKLLKYQSEKWGKAHTHPRVLVTHSAHILCPAKILIIGCRCLPHQHCMQVQVLQESNHVFSRHDGHGVNGATSLPDLGVLLLFLTLFSASRQARILAGVSGISDGVPLVPGTGVPT